MALSRLASSEPDITIDLVAASTCWTAATFAWSFIVL
jgi:hypothetical protein